MTNSVTCRACGKEASGNFCQHCGAPLGGRFCNQCGSELAADARFCSQCGAPAPGRGAPTGTAAAPGRKEPAGGSARPARRSGSGPAPVTPDLPAETAGLFSPQTLPWWIAGAAMFVLIAFLGVQMLQNEGPSVPPGQSGAPPVGAGAGTGGAAPDISNMTPIQAADRLFDRVMRSVEAGDSAQAQAFLPMAIAAYERARPLTHDGLFHLSMLQRTAGQYEDALATAQQILEDDPNHLLGLLAAAEAADALGDARANEYYRRILEVYDAEMAAPKQEYVDHRMITEKLKADVETILSGR